MKLIDRDKFISDMFDLYIEQKWKPSDIHFSLLDVRNNIDFKGYEVKAIPIEWILKWACEFIDPNSEGYKMAMELVHDWRKENEHKESD